MHSNMNEKLIRLMTLTILSSREQVCMHLDITVPLQKQFGYVLKSFYLNAVFKI